MSDRSAASTAGDMAGQATDSARKLYDASGEVIQHASNQVQTTTDQVVSFVREQPVAAVLSALIVGYVLGKIT
jgi:ElaB/YqjD/DUF883 family membrane-anchored ribosome-binding protein